MIIAAPDHDKLMHRRPIPGRVRTGRTATHTPVGYNASRWRPLLEHFSFIATIPSRLQWRSVVPASRGKKKLIYSYTIHFSGIRSRHGEKRETTTLSSISMRNRPCVDVTMTATLDSASALFGNWQKISQQSDRIPSARSHNVILDRPLLAPFLFFFSLQKSKNADGRAELPAQKDQKAVTLEGRWKRPRHGTTFHRHVGVAVLAVTRKKINQPSWSAYHQPSAREPRALVEIFKTCSARHRNKQTAPFSPPPSDQWKWKGRTIAGFTCLPGAGGFQ